MLVLASCVNIDPIKDRLADLDARLKAVEANLTTVTTNANGLSSAIRALESNVTVDKVTKNEDGYTITFTDGTYATIKNGSNGSNGSNGANGKDGVAPQVGVKEVDGTLVWTVNNEVLNDAAGKPVPAISEVPEFKFEEGNWYFRFGDGAWTLCADTASSAPEIIETENSVIISIGGNKIILPKEVISPAIESIDRKIARLFVPVGESLNLQEWFDVSPEGALKSSVDYTFTEGAPFTITDAGVLTATGRGSYNVTIVSKSNADVSEVITIRTAPCPVNTEPAPEPRMVNKVYLFDNTLECFNGMVGYGGSATWNPFNNSISALVGTGGAGHNVYIRPQPVNSEATLQSGHLHFMYYISDVSKLKPGAGQVELTSSANPDAKELNWSTDFLANCKNGWNEIVLDFKNGHVEGEFDPANINWFRFFNETTVAADDNDVPIYEAIQVKDIYVYADYVPVESITANGNAKRGAILFVPQGQTIDLKDYFTVGPEGASKKNVVYESANPASVSVDANGIATGVSRGSIAITIKPQDPPTRAEEVPSITIYVRTDNMPASEELEKSEEVLFHSCDNIEFFTKSAADNRTIDFVAEGKQEGASWYKSTLTKQAEWVVINRASSKVNARMTSPHRGHVKFWFYIDPREDGNNAAKLKSRCGTNGRIEVSNDGGNKGIYWKTHEVLANCQDGWNLIDLKFKDALPYNVDSYNLNPEAISWFRIYIGGPAAQYDTYTIGIDGISFYEDYEETTAQKVYLLHPTFEEYRDYTVGGSVSWCPAEQAFAALISQGGVASKNMYFNIPDVNSGCTIANGHLHFKWYINDVSVFTAIGIANGNQLELCSGGAADNKELSFDTAFIKYCHNGWNDITLDFKRNIGDSGFDPAVINWFRFYESAGGGNAADMLKDVYVYAE